MNREPVVTTASITAFVAAVLALVTAFGLHLTKQETAAIMGGVIVVAPIVAGLIGRQFVTPTAKAVPAARVSPAKAAAKRGKNGRFQ